MSTLMSFDEFKKDHLAGLIASKKVVAHTNLKQGDIVKKSAGLAYEIDNVDAYKHIGQYADSVVLPYGLIYRALNPSMGGILQLFEREGKREGGETRVPFSRALQTGNGECLEKAILTQLAVQPKVESLLINGAMRIDAEECWGHHAYNILDRDGTSYLVDVENPLRVDENKVVTHMYIAPIVGINKNLEIEVTPEWKQGRTYALF